MVANLRQIVAGRNEGEVTLTLELDPTSTDGGSATPVRRLVDWDLASDPFSFDVQVPAGAYTNARVTATIYVLCDAGPTADVIATGASSSTVRIATTNNTPMQFAMSGTGVTSPCM